MKKLKTILIIALFSLFFVFELIVIVMNIYSKAPAHKSLKNSEQAFAIPWTNKGFIAQGITYDKASDNFYLTGYMKDGTASPIFVVCSCLTDFLYLCFEIQNLAKRDDSIHFLY